jgi:hypothetical protein
MGDARGASRALLYLGAFKNGKSKKQRFDSRGTGKLGTSRYRTSCKSQSGLRSTKRTA